MLIKKAEMAKLLNVSVPTIDRLMLQGLPYIKVGKSVRFEPAEVLAWLKNNR